MKLIVKKIPVILVSFFLAANAYGNAALLRVLSGPQGPRFLAMMTGGSPGKIAALKMDGRISLYQAEIAKNRNRDILKEDVSSSDGANIEEIRKALALSVFMGNIPLYREQMVKLLYTPISELNIKEKGSIFSEETLEMMQEHPAESVRDQFHTEYLDLLNHLLFKVRGMGGMLFRLPKGHISLFKEHIPELELETTPWGRAIINDDGDELMKVYNNLLENGFVNGSVRDLLAQTYAKSRSGSNIQPFSIEQSSSVLVLMHEMLKSIVSMLVPSKGNQ